MRKAGKPCELFFYEPNVIAQLAIINTTKQSLKTIFHKLVRWHLTMSMLLFFPIGAMVLICRFTHFVTELYILRASFYYRLSLNYAIATIFPARVPWPTGNCFDLGCCGCLYSLLRSCVLAVSER